METEGSKGCRVRGTAVRGSTPRPALCKATLRTMRSQLSLFLVLRCSTSGCSGSFPNMQKLMEHTRQHHKPNIYFQCESCRTKLRSYRNLLGHLHTCSKVPRGRPKAAEATPPFPVTPNTNPKAMDQPPPQLESVSSPQQVPFQIANPNGSLPGAVPQPGSSEPPVLGPPILALQEPSPPKLTPPQLAEAASQALVRMEASKTPPTINPAAPEVPDNKSQFQTQSRSAEAAPPAAGAAASSPPGPSAVWKKNQGTACSRRVLWEHTRGRYTCIQCGHTVTNRKDMTQHIKGQHSGSKAAEATGSSAGSS
ncbi:zinc finger protein 414 isoform X2 [Melanotaenia boesemani]|uniref:zinc finger protein 414 isoform X2 n=1 Tax=Melanotaenia boesemani TaxID=1250792 RepID=UPI001C05A502|nr:zinc finger protein 414 isoform X2 [Melanotaenia boesemani]